MLRWFRCWIGLHCMRSHHWERNEPHPRGFPITAEMIDKVWCDRCGYILYDQHVIWNGDKFVHAETARATNS